MAALLSVLGATCTRAPQRPLGHRASGSAPAALPNGASVPPAPPPFSWLVAPSPRPSFERAARVGDVLWAVEQGRGYRLVGQRWEAASSPPPPAPAPAVALESAEVVRLRDGQRFPLPVDEEVVLAGLGADDLPIVVTRSGGVWAFLHDRVEIAHTSEPDGSRAYFERSLGPGFAAVRGAAPPDIVAIVPGQLPLLVGREGDVSRIREQRLEPVVVVPRPRSLALVVLHGGGVLAVHQDGLTLARGGRASAIAIDAAMRDMLEEAARGSEALGLSRVEAIALAPGDQAVIGAGRSVARVTASGTTTWPLPGNGEVTGLVRDARLGFVVLDHNGHVVALRAGALARLGNIAGADVAHPIGAFTADDGGARLVDHDRRLTCVAGAGLQACGPHIRFQMRLAHSVSGALVVEDQSVRTQLVTADAVREIPDVAPGALRRSFAGSPGALYALADNAVWRLERGAWRELARIPTTYSAQCLAVSAQAVHVGVRGGAVLTMNIP